MTRHDWIHDGRKADGAALTSILSAARADKMRRLENLRAAMQSEAADDADARVLHKATKRRLREIDRELRKLDAHLRKVGAASRKASRERDRTILTYARSYGGGQIGERDIKQFDKLFHFGKSSPQEGDGLSSFHCKFTSRGFGERRANRSRTYRPGEAVRHLRYIIRDGAREPGVNGLVSNISQDPDQLAGFFKALEELEAHDRANANVYMSLVLSLPYELTPAAREQILRDTCALFAEHDLPYAGVLHAPEPFTFEEIHTHQQSRIGTGERRDPKEAYSHAYTRIGKVFAKEFARNPTVESSIIAEQAWGPIGWRLGMPSNG